MTTLDEACLQALRGRAPESIVQRCCDADLDVVTLLGRTDEVRSALVGAGIGRGDIVALKGRRDSWLLPVLLGVLGSGAAYTVIPFNSPGQVEESLLETVRPAAMVTWDELTPASWIGLPSVPLGADVRIVLGDAPRPGSLRGERTAADPCYVCNTSGTSGRPKCVLVPHSSVMAFHRAARQLIDLGSDDIVAARSSAAFDLSVWELYAPLLAGASMVLLTEQVAVDVTRLHETLVRERCTVLSTTPSAAYQLGSHDASAGGGLFLRRLLVGGEAGDGARLQDVLEAPGFAGCRLDNWYGPTEATVSVTGGELTPDRLRSIDLTIGYPLPGVGVLIDAEEPVGLRYGDTMAEVIGLAGELVVSGGQLAHGYLSDPRATASAFIPDPGSPGARCYRTGDIVEVDDQGWLTYHGRRDSQVQLRGYRLELTEVERALAAQDGVRWSHAALGGTESDVLLAWVATTDGGVPLDRERLWRGLYATLPRHAVPAAIVEVDEVPVTEGQKLAVDRLPQPTSGDFLAGLVSRTEPTTETEWRLVAIWQSLLDLEDVGTTHHFFMLGGHSLLVARLYAAVRREFGVHPRMSDVMENLTIRQLALLIDRLEAERDEAAADGEGAEPRRDAAREARMTKETVR